MNLSTTRSDHITKSTTFYKYKYRPIIEISLKKINILNLNPSQCDSRMNYLPTYCKIVFRKTNSRIKIKHTNLRNSFSLRHIVNRKKM